MLLADAEAPPKQASRFGLVGRLARERDPAEANGRTNVPTRLTTRPSHRTSELLRTVQLLLRSVLKAFPWRGRAGNAPPRSHPASRSEARSTSPHPGPAEPPRGGRWSPHNPLPPRARPHEETVCPRTDGPRFVGRRRRGGARAAAGGAGGPAPARTGCCRCCSASRCSASAAWSARAWSATAGTRRRRRTRERITLAALPDGRPRAGPGLRRACSRPRPDSLCAGLVRAGRARPARTARTRRRPGCTVAPRRRPGDREGARAAGRRAARPARCPPDAEIVRDEGGSALTAGAPGADPGRGARRGRLRHGQRTTWPARATAAPASGSRCSTCTSSARPSRYTDFLGSIRTWAAGVDQIFDASAAETGGSRHVRFVTTPQCRVDVAEVQLPPRARWRRSRDSIDALQTLGYNRTDRKYLIFADTNVYCGIAHLHRRPAGRAWATATTAARRTAGSTPAAGAPRWPPAS